MPRRNAYAQGTPNWFELRTTDLAAAKVFYAALFGWVFDDVSASDGVSFSRATKDGGVAAALAPSVTDLSSSWHVYLAVDDIDAALGRAEAAGGAIVVRPVDVPGAGRIATLTDCTGASIGLWQAGPEIGATVVNEPGAVIWTELMTDDVDAACHFYEAVAGLSADTSDVGNGPYTSLRSQGEAVAGVSRSIGPDAPSHWHVYFAVADVAQAVATVTEQGGDVLAGPLQTPIGPMAAVRDPLGAIFSVFQFEPRDDEPAAPQA